MSEQSISPEKSEDGEFLGKLREIGREVALFNASRNDLDRDAKLGALDAIEKLRATTDAAEKKRLIFELGKQVGMFNASKSESDRKAKLKALALIDELG